MLRHQTCQSHQSLSKMSTNTENSTPELQNDIESFLEIVIEEKDHPQVTLQEENTMTKPVFNHKIWNPQSLPETRFRVPITPNAYAQSEYNSQQLRFMRNANTHGFYEPRASFPIWAPPNSPIGTPPIFSSWMTNQHVNTFFPMNTAYAHPVYAKNTYRKHITKLVMRLTQKYQVNLQDVISDLTKLNDLSK